MDPPEPCAVYLSGLRLRHFRNLGIQDLTLPPGGVAVVGGNAQGKSNLLEAIYYLETLRSFRGARDEQLVAFGEQVFRVAGDLVGGEGDGLEVAAAFDRRGRRKKVTVDGHEPDRLGEAIGKLCAVLFSPDDVALVRDGPGGRRRFLDLVLSLNVRGYLETLQGYRRLLAQRNAALRGGADPALVRAWEPQLAEAGGRVMEIRRAWVDRWGEAFSRYYARISGGRRGTMRYRPSVPLEGEGEGAAVAALLEGFRRSRAREERLGMTVVGPHRDELVLGVEADGGELPLRDFGSGGQVRTAALALRLVEAETIRESRGREPIVLLDDLFAELDAARSERVLDLLETEETGQVILTAPKESDVRLRRNLLPRWRIRDGRVET